MAPRFMAEHQRVDTPASPENADLIPFIKAHQTAMFLTVED